MKLNLKHEDLRIDDFIFAHGHRENRSGLYRIEGHIHPVVELRYGPIKVRMKCFVEGTERMVLPAFGTLTGGYPMEFEPSDRVHAVTGAKVVTLPLQESAQRRAQN